jgi:hypothetical protein
MVELVTAAVDVSSDAPAPTEPVACTAETAECTCPDFCERDHEND